MNQRLPSSPAAGFSRRRFVHLAVAGGGALVATAGGAARSVTTSTSPVSADDAARFLAAAASGDLATVERLLTAAPGLLTAKGGDGRSAFALAHLAGHREVGEHLVERGYLSDAHEAALAGQWERFAELAAADVSVVDRDHPIGGSVMYAAAAGGAGADIWRAYAVTADPNARPRGADGATALQAALAYRDLATAEMTAASLLGNDADPNLVGAGVPPPLHLAAERGSVELVEMLVRRHADVGATDGADGAGRTALEAARAAGQESTAALLARHAEIPRTHSTSRTAYDVDGKPYAPPDIGDIPLVERRRFVGQSHGNLEYVREAVKRDPRLVHSVATTSEICVEACAHTGRKEVVEYLLEHGAVYSLPTAVLRDDRARVEALLDEDPRRIHERGAHDFALLWYPVIGRCGLEMTELLLARGAEVEEQHFLGTTALHWAAMRGPIELVELLIDNGADVNRRGRKFGAEGRTPLESAVMRDQDDIARLLRDRGARA